MFFVFLYTYRNAHTSTYTFKLGNLHSNDEHCIYFFASHFKLANGIILVMIFLMPVSSLVFFRLLPGKIKIPPRWPHLCLAWHSEITKVSEFSKHNTESSFDDEDKCSVTQSSCSLSEGLMS